MQGGDTMKYQEKLQLAQQYDRRNSMGRKDADELLTMMVNAHQRCSRCERTNCLGYRVNGIMMCTVNED
jgi:hypothetical protein